ncbi:MAG: beta-galactosidase trimerization domain-containing protein, partial [Bacillota bacterium]|nr:beta-galactosidase trimerization domain-containing protein [Bacillota bacterium]
GWNGTICYCPSCRKRYYDETGCEIPEVVNWYDPDWVRFQRSREAWFTDFTRTIDQALRSRQPDATVAYQCGTSLGGWIGAASQDFLSMSDYLAGDFDSNALSCSTICKILSSATRNKPIEFMTARCTSLADHTTIKSYQQFRQNVAVALSRNCAFCFIDAIDPIGTMNNRFYEQMGRLNQEMKVYMDAIAPDATLLRDVTIYYNLESGVDVSMNHKSITEFSNTIWGGSIGTQLPRLRNMTKAFIAHHLAFDIACWNSRQDMLAESQVIVVPNQLMLDDDEIDMLKQFAMAGGSVIMTGRSGYCNKSGQIRTDGSLADLTGITLIGETKEDVVYFRPDEKWFKLFSPYDPANPLSVQRTAMLVQVHPEDDVLARLTLPCSHSREIHQFGSAISNPPWNDTDYPAVTLHRYGKGKVMYLAAPLEEIEHAAQQEIFCALVRVMMTHESLVRTDAPAWLEVLAYHDVKTQSCLIYTCKTMEAYHTLSTMNTTLSLRLPQNAGELRKIGTNEIVSHVRESGRITWTETEISDFNMYRYETIA